MKKILITGGNSLLAKKFNALYKNKYIIYNTYRKKKNLVNNEFNIALEDENEVQSLFKKIGNIDVVLHFSAQTTVWKSKSNPLEDANSNIIATLNMITHSIKHKVKKFFFTSSEAVYGNINSPIESSPHKPNNPYGISKNTCEEYITYFSKISEVDFHIVRPAFVIDQDMKRNPLFDILTQIKTGKVELYQSIDSVYNFVSSTSICIIIENMVTGNIEYNNLNIVNFSNTKLRDIFDKLNSRYQAEVTSSLSNIQIATLNSQYKDIKKIYQTDVLKFCIDYLDCK